jgi:hypothetical protein
MLFETRGQSSKMTIIHVLRKDPFQGGNNAGREGKDNIYDHKCYVKS